MREIPPYQYANGSYLEPPPREPTTEESMQRARELIARLPKKPQARLSSKDRLVEGARRAAARRDQEGQ